MQHIKEVLMIIEKNSRTLYERMGEIQNISIPGPDREITAGIKELWMEFAAEKDPLRFTRRLTWDGLVEGDLNRLLGGSMPPEKKPPWLELLGRVLALAGETSLEEIRQSDFLNKEKKHPFEEILSLFVLTGMNSLTQRAVPAWSVPAGSAMADLQSQLFKRLVFISQQVLFHEFSIFRGEKCTLQTSNLAGGISPDLFMAWTGHSGDRHYLEFIRELLAGRLAVLFGEYPVLARLMAEITCYWVDFSLDFMKALYNDRREIADTFNAGKDPGPVVAAECGLSDPHNRGRSVILLVFESGLRLIYKPRNLGIEVAYFRLLSWLNQRGGESMFKRLRTVSRGSYGWVEFCPHLPCGSREEVRSFYRRSGMLLCVLYALAGSDFHLENIIASGQYPVAVDLEVLLQPAESGSGTLLSRPSVMQTMLLPFMYRKGRGGLYAVGGLGEGRPDTEKVLMWKNINSDSMRLEESCNAAPAMANGVYLDGEPVLAADYCGEIMEGFKKAYRLFEDNKKILLSPEGPLQAFDGTKVRYVFRSTQTYFDLLYNSLLPRYMRGGLLRSARIDKISRPLLKMSEKPIYWGVLKKEHLALDRLDIPLIYVNTGSSHLELSPGVSINGYFGETPLEAVTRRIESFSPSDLAYQTNIIEASLNIQKKIAGNGGTGNFGKYTKDIIPAGPEELIDKAGHIAREIAESVIGLPGEAFWACLDDGDRSYRLNFTGVDLYSGSAGILLFLAAWAFVSGQRTLFDSLAGPVRLAAAKSDQSSDSWSASLGAGSGLGGIIYSFVKIWKFTGEPSFLEEARRLASSVSGEQIDADRDLDIVFGCSGLLLGLLELYAAEKRQEVLQTALKCGERLLNSRTTGKAGYRAWKVQGLSTLNQQPLLGFSHGAAGISHALARLFRVTGDTRFMEAAREAILYEDSLFSCEEGNWPDLRLAENKNPRGYTSSWCHGGPGVLISRLEAGDLVEDHLRRRDIEYALDTILKKPPGAGPEDLCCGQFGLIDVLITASLRLGRKDLYSEALKRATWFIHRERNAGVFLTGADLPGGNINYSFFKGISGVGYVLLRLTCPGLPSVLGFD